MGSGDRGRGKREQVWLYPPALTKLDRARALLQLEGGGAMLSRPEAVEALLDRLLPELGSGQERTST